MSEPSIRIAIALAIAFAFGAMFDEITGRDAGPIRFVSVGW